MNKKKGLAWITRLVIGEHITKSDFTYIGHSRYMIVKTMFRGDVECIVVRESKCLWYWVYNTFPYHSSNLENCESYIKSLKKEFK